jgi:glutaredoxin 3
MADASPTITIYTSNFCAYCVAAKNLLKSRGYNWTEVRVDLDATGRQEMLARANRSSVPQIFIGDVYVGGFDELAALDRKGELAPLLVGASA